ncbi:MAG TPA: RsmE family RNA methyltransferase [Candidatus Methylomirabilis sp.]|nr:RsmE family RNA methyltransferase [Candidatus Methylomirabilis sp.]
MTEPLFFAERLPEAGATTTLTGEEAHHAAASRRLHVGDTLWLFDGLGGMARATLKRVGARGRELELQVEDRRTEPYPWPLTHLACAIPKGDRQQVLLDMATQLGMSSFTPLACERSVVKPRTDNRERWRRICLEACKQSRRLYLPVIHEPASPRQVATQAASTGVDLWIAHPGDRAIPISALTAGRNPTRAVTILIGPEGGFTQEEVDAVMAASATAVTLGRVVLRIETAAVALLAMLRLNVDGADQTGRAAENVTLKDLSSPGERLLST